MKKYLKFVIVISIFFICISRTVFGVPITVPNFSFEDSVSGSITIKTQNWMDRDNSGLNVITNWYFRMEDSATINTSVEGNNGGDGSWCASIQAVLWPEGIWQELDHPIVANKNYTLTVHIGNGWGATSIELVLRYHDGINRHDIVSKSFAISTGGGSLQEDASVSFVAQPGAPYLGKNIGVEIQNDTPNDQSWAWADNVRVEESDAYVAQPANVFPADGATNVNVTPTLIGTVFAGSGTHNASQWQLDRDEEFSEITWDSGEDSVNLTNVTVPSALSQGELYFWRVRYKSSGGLWSDWSEATEFETEGEPDYLILSDDRRISPSSSTIYSGTKDASLNENDTDNNNGGNNQFEVCQYWHVGLNDSKNTVLAFPKVSDYLPAEDWLITNAWIELYFASERNGIGYPKTVFMRRILRGTDDHTWGEGDGDGIDGRDALPGEVNWDAAQSGDSENWAGTRASGYTDPNDEGGGSGTVLSTNFGWIRFPITIETVKLWQTNDLAASLGVSISETFPPVETNGTKVFYSSESSETNKRPRLYIAAQSIATVVRPVNLSPANETTTATLTPSFIGSEFQPIGGGTHSASHWQIATDDQFTDLVLDEESPANLTTNTITGGVLGNAEYRYWRVRYQKDGSGWSPWSMPTLFRTPGFYTPNKLVLSEGNRIISYELFNTNAYSGAKDAHLIESSPENNTGGYSEMESCKYVSSDLYDNKTLVLAFQNVRQYVPTHTYEITNAWIELFFLRERNGQGFDKSLFVHRILRGTDDHVWNEGTATDGIDGREALTGEVSWFCAQIDDIEEWAGASSNNCTATIAEGNGVVLNTNFGWVTFPLKLETVLEWQTNDAAAALGVCIRETHEAMNTTGTFAGTKVFATKESATISARPRLCLGVEYIPEPIMVLFAPILLLAFVRSKLKS